MSLYCLLSTQPQPCDQIISLFCSHLGTGSPWCSVQKLKSSPVLLPCHLSLSGVIFLYSLIQPHWPPCSSPNMSGMLPPWAMVSSPESKGPHGASHIRALSHPMHLPLATGVNQNPGVSSFNTVKLGILNHESDNHRCLNSQDLRIP